MITFACPHCKRKLRVKDDSAGKRKSCPVCKKVIVIPAQTTTVAGGKLPAAPADLETLAAATLAEKKEAEPQAPTFIDFTCFYCDAELHVPAEDAGKNIPCPECRKIIKVPLLQKAAPRDWRQAPGQAGPSMARRDGPALEGAWGTQTSKAAVSRQALVEADVIQEVREPVTVGQWIKRGILTAIALAAVVWGVVWGLGYLKQRSERGVVALAENGLAGHSAAALTPELRAELQRALGEYHHLAATPDAQGRAGRLGLQRLQLARQEATKIADTFERQAVLRDLLDTQTALALYDSDDGLTEISQTLALIQPGPVRADAVRALARRAAATGNAMLVRQIIYRGIKGSAAVPVARAGTATKKAAPAASTRAPGASPASSPASENAEQIDCLAILGQELIQAGHVEDARQLAEVPSAQAMPKHLIALRVMLNLPEPEESDDVVLIAAGRVEGQARKGELDAAKRTLEEQLKDPTRIRLNTLIAIAEICIEKNEKHAGREYLDQAVELSWTRFRADTVRQRLKLAEVAAGLDPLYAENLAGNYLSGTPQHRARLAAFKAKLQQQGETRIDPEQAKGIDPQSGAYGVALMLIGRHNARLDPRPARQWAESVQPETARPLAAAGVALGLRDRQRE